MANRTGPVSERFPGYLVAAGDNSRSSAGKGSLDQKVRSGGAQPTNAWTNATHENMWQRPKQETGTYAQQYLSAYKSRWMLQRDPATAAFVARQSVMARLQNYPTFRKTADQ